MEYALLNGQLLPVAATQLTLPNRGLTFNDGFFETMVWAAEGLRWAEEHFARMQKAAAALELALPAALGSPQALQQTLQRLAEATHTTPLRLRLQLWRAGGGLYAPSTAETAWLGTAAPFVPNDAPINEAAFAETIRTHFSPVSFCKGPYALHYVLAAQERETRRLGELLLLDARGHVAEAVAAAVFWVKNDTLYTPALEAGCVAGIRRAHLLRVAQAHGVGVCEGLFGQAEVLGAGAVFTANVAGIRSVERLAGVKLASAEHPLLAALRRWEAVA